jgi:hypothetical protein
MAFCATRRPPSSLFDATPGLLVQFLAFQYANCPGRRTVVHHLSCPVVGTDAVDSSVCKPSCGLYLSASRITVMHMALRTFFNAAISTAPYDMQQRTGNPAVSYVCVKYVGECKRDQLAAEVVVKQARPTFMFQLKSVMIMMHMSLRFTQMTPEEAWNLRVHICFLLCTFFCTDRSFDLARCKGRNCIVVLEHKSWVLNHVRGKVIRDMPRVAAIIAHSDPDLDPIHQLELLFEMATSLSITDSTSSLLFREYLPNGRLSSSPITTSRMNVVIRQYYGLAGIWDGHTIHGLRTGAAVELALRGAPVDVVAAHVGWSEDTCKHYLRLIDVLQLCGTSNRFEADFMDGVSSRAYDAFSRLLVARSA